MAGTVRRAVAGLVGAGALMVSQACEGQVPVLQCTVSVPAAVAVGAPVPLTVALRNPGSSAVQVLTWGTPFEEGWLQPFVEVTRDGEPLAYGGATVKRGEPDRDEYLRVGAGEVRSASLDLREVFVVDQPGRYRVVPRITLHDVVGAGGVIPRERNSHVAAVLACPAVEFQVMAGV